MKPASSGICRLLLPIQFGLSRHWYIYVSFMINSWYAATALYVLSPRGVTIALTFMRLEATALSLRRDPRLLRIPPYVSAFCIAIGVIWLLLLPLDDYSRRTYISENALLPGQVHTYFGGSEQHIFRAFRHEIDLLADKNNYEFVTESHLLNIWRHIRG